MKDLIMRPIPPFRLDLTVWALRRLPTNLIDRWDNNIYRRVMVFGNTAVDVSIIQTGPPTTPELRISVDGSVAKKHVSELSAILEKMLGLRVDLTDFFHLAANDKRLFQIVQRFMGLKPPRFPTIFEALVNAVACQQLSLNVGIHLSNRLSATYGLGKGEFHAFPRPTDLCIVRPEDLRRLGLSNRKAQNILEISQASVAGHLDENLFESLDEASIAARLQELPGVGRWTAQYASLRGLGRLNVFPADDVGGQNKLQAWLKLEKRPDYETTNRILHGWSPYQGLVYYYMLLTHLWQQKYIET